MSFPAVLSTPGPTKSSGLCSWCFHLARLYLLFLMASRLTDTCYQLINIAISATFYALVDWNASRIMKSIKTLIAEEACVVRDGSQQLIPAASIVVGDVIVLSAGDRVPADLRIVQASSDLRFDRSLLTGERCVSLHCSPMGL